MGGEPYMDIVKTHRGVKGYSATQGIIDEVQKVAEGHVRTDDMPAVERTVLPQQLLDYLAEHNIDLDDVPEPTPGPNMALINYRAGLLTGIR